MKLKFSLVGFTHLLTQLLSDSFFFLIVCYVAGTPLHQEDTGARQAQPPSQEASFHWGEMGKSDMALFYAGVPLCEIINACGFYFIYLFTFGCDGSSLLLRLSLVRERGLRFSWGAPASHCGVLLRSTGYRAHGLQWLQPAGLVAPRHMESPWTRDQICVPCIGRWLLNHWTTREVLLVFLNCWIWG